MPQGGQYSLENSAWGTVFTSENCLGGHFLGGGGKIPYDTITTMRHLRQLPPPSNQEVQCSVQTLFWPQSHALTTHLLFHMTAVLPNFGELANFDLCN